MNTNTEHIVDTTIYGIQKVNLDNKKRVFMPTEWRDLFSLGSWVYILPTSNYLILVPGHLYQQNLDIIAHAHRIDVTGRILIGDKLLDALGITMDTEVSLVGKGNHIELYWDPKKLQTAISRSHQAVSHFQAELTSKLQKYPS